MDKKRKARRIVLIALAVIFVLAVVYYAAMLVDMYSDRVYLYYQGELYRAHRVLGGGYELPPDAEELAPAVTVSGGKQELSADFETTKHSAGDMTVYYAPSQPDRLYVVEEISVLDSDVWIFAKR